MPITLHFSVFPVVGTVKVALLHIYQQTHLFSQIPKFLVVTNIRC